MNLSPLPVQRFYSNIGLPLVGGKLFTYIAGTTTKIDTYRNAAGSALNSNPIILNFRGEADIWLDPTLTYKFVLAGPLDTDPPTNPIWSVDNIQAGLTIGQMTQQFLGQIIYPRSAAEIARSVIPIAYIYPWGNILRYGADPIGVADSTTAIQNAVSVATYATATFDVGGAVYVPKGVYKTTATITFDRGVKFYGDGYLASQIRPTGAINPLSYQPGALTEAGMIFEDFSVQGDAATTLDLVRIDNATVVTFNRVRLRDTSQSCVKYTGETDVIEFHGCVLESFGLYGHEIGALVAVFRDIGTQVNANSVNGVAYVGWLTGGASTQFYANGVNVNGNNLLDNMYLAAGTAGASEVTIESCYCEFMAGSAVRASNTAIFNQLTIDACSMLGGSSVQFDLNNGATHKDVVIKNTRSPMVSGTFFDPGATRNFRVENISIDGGTLVAGYASGDPVILYQNGFTVLGTPTPLVVPQNAQNVNYTFVLADNGKDVVNSTGASATWTIPPSSSVSWPVGAKINLVMTNTNNLTLARGAGVGLFLEGGTTDSNKTVVRISEPKLRYLGGNNWVVSGAGVS